jgi:hypothetical protein
VGAPLPTAEIKTTIVEVRAGLPKLGVLTHKQMEKREALEKLLDASRGHARTTKDALTVRGRVPDWAIAIGFDDFFHAHWIDQWTLLCCTRLGDLRFTVSGDCELPSPPFRYCLYYDNNADHLYEHPEPLIKGDYVEDDGSRFVVQAINQRHDEEKLPLAYCLPR